MKLQKFYDTKLFRGFLRESEIIKIQDLYDDVRPKSGKKRDWRINKQWRGSILLKALGLKKLQELDKKYQAEKSPTVNNLPRFANNTPVSDIKISSTNGGSEDCIEQDGHDDNDKRKEKSFNVSISDSYLDLFTKTEVSKRLDVIDSDLVCIRSLLYNIEANGYDSKRRDAVALMFIKVMLVVSLSHFIIFLIHIFN